MAVASGKSLSLNAIVAPAPVVIHRNIGAPRAVRRNRRKLKDWKGALTTNETYDYPARDQRKNRKLK